MPQGGVILLAIPYEHIAGTATALQEEAKRYPVGYAIRAWLEKKTVQLWAEHEIWLESEDGKKALPQVRKSIEENPPSPIVTSGNSPTTNP